MKAILISLLLIGVGNAEQLRITLYNKAKWSGQVTDAVVSDVRRIFHYSGIEIDWVHGEPNAPEAFLVVYEQLDGGRKLELACRVRRDIALDILPDTLPGLKKEVLGVAHPWTRIGLNVRIFDHHIRVAAERENRKPETVLSHAIAHEIGHVLLRSSAHAAGGLMAAFWGGNEYEWMGRGALYFTGEESRKMRQTLSGAACATAK